MMNIFKRIRILYILKRHAIPHALWRRVIERLSGTVQGFSAVEMAHLRELSTLFLYHKKFTGAQGLEVTLEMKAAVAIQACIMVLTLGMEYFDGWHEIVIYPGAFRVVRDQMDAEGIVHHEENALSGESWSKGPVILSWQDIAQEMQGMHRGRNVVIHEFAHKLDMLNGRANGMPPLHSGMQREQWTETFSRAYSQLLRQLDHHHRGFVNPYAATSPAEFFAVISEYFFSAPDILQTNCPGVYQQMQLFYRQDSLCRF